MSCVECVPMLVVFTVAVATIGSCFSLVFIFISLALSILAASLGCTNIFALLFISVSTLSIPLVARLSGAYLDSYCTSRLSNVFSIIMTAIALWGFFKYSAMLRLFENGLLFLSNNPSLPQLLVVSVSVVSGLIFFVAAFALPLSGVVLGVELLLLYVLKIGGVLSPNLRMIRPMFALLILSGSVNLMVGFVDRSLSLISFG